MKISCIIPTCDRQEFLIETIKSVLNQSVKPMEIIIVNNGKDKIILPDELVKEINIYNIIHYAGAAQARNFGASVAQGDYLAFLDDDDLWSQDYLKNVSMAIEQGALCIVSRLDKLEDGKVLGLKNTHGKLSINKILLLNPGITGSNIVVAKEIFLQIGGFDPKLPPSEDKSLVLEILLANKDVKTLPDNQAIIRMHNKTRLSSSANKMAEGIYQFTLKYSKLMNKKQYLENWLKIFKYRYEAGNKKAFIPFVILYLTNRPDRIIPKLIKLWKKII